MYIAIFRKYALPRIHQRGGKVELEDIIAALRECENPDYIGFDNPIVPVSPECKFRVLRGLREFIPSFIQVSNY